MYERIPQELKELPQWVCWNRVPDPARHSGDRKVPINPANGQLAKSNDPATWGTYPQAVGCARSRELAGIGFMFAGGYFGVDIDSCREALDAFREGGQADNLVSQFIHRLGSYAEVSVSGNGVHILCRGTLPPRGRRRGNVEMYESGRFFTMTGDAIGPYAVIADGTEAIRALHEKYIGGGAAIVRGEAPREQPAAGIVEDGALIAAAERSRQGDAFRRLMAGDWRFAFPSQSEADMSLCAMLAFWTAKDEAQMDRIFRTSGLMRPKWDRAQSGSTYGRLTLRRAIERCAEVYRAGEEYGVRFSTAEPAPRSLDDTGNAQRLCDSYGDSIRYCYMDKRWMVYDGRRWEPDYAGALQRMADRVVEKMHRELMAQMEDPPADADPKIFEKACRAHEKASRSNRGKTAMIKETEHLVPILPKEMDTHPMLLNTPSGVVNLTTGALDAHDAMRYLTRITAAEYTDRSDCPRWDAFLREIFGEDDDLIRYVQKAVGYTLTGSVAEQCAFFCYGTGRNGKSVFCDVLSDVLGDYAMAMQPETILDRQKASGGPSGDIARLRGARFVTSAEPNEGVRLNEGILKQLTGGDTVTARRLYGDEFEFKPEFKLWMTTNHKPVIRGTDMGIWRRIRVIPFTVQIAPSRVDPYLTQKLLKEAGGILRWAVEGCIRWQRERLVLPNAVTEAIREYRSEMDVLGTFLTDKTEAGVEFEVSASALYAAYSRWCEDNNEYRMSGTKFGRRMAERYERIHTRSGNVFHGLRLPPYSAAVPVQTRFAL